MLLATSAGYFISSDADGSGIPEMKTVLSGINIYRYFSFNAFIGKVLGLYAALVGGKNIFLIKGASIGKVGPYVHISCLICNRLVKINYFSSINKSTSSKNNMLTAAVAAGVTLANGTPLSAVLFSIESTASIYIVSNIWKSFFVAVVCIFMSKLLNSSKTILLTEISSSRPINFSSEIFIFAIEGFIGGIIGATISTLVAKAAYIRRKSKVNFINNRFRYAAIIAVVVATITFIVDTLRSGDRAIMTFMFSEEVNNIKGLTRPIEGYKLFIFFMLKFLIAILSLSMNIPSGAFGPIFAIGALYGRLFGRIIKSTLDLSEEAIYSMIGASCVFSGATHSVSASLMIFEMTGQTSYLAPLLLATLIANLTGQALAMNIFDVFLVIKNLPHLPSVKSAEMYSLTASDIMNKVNFYLTMDNLYIINCLTLFTKLPKKYNLTIPLIDDKGTIRYTVTAKNLFKYVSEVYEKNKMSYNIKNQSNFSEYFSFIRKKFVSIKRSFFQQIRFKFRKLYITLRDKEKLKLNKNFEEESNFRLISIFRESK